MPFRNRYTRKRVLGILAVHHREGVEFHLVLFQEAQAAHDAVERGRAAFIHAIEVMELGRAVNRNPDQEMVLRQKLAPAIVQQDAVGLKSVFNLLAVGILVLDGDDLAKEVHAQQGGFAALPGKGNCRRILRGNELRDVRLQNRVGHGPILLLAVKVFLFEIKAVAAVQVANRAHRLGHDVKGREGFGRVFVALLHRSET